jgi:alkyl hydroperoxide reductase subunit AhpF
MGLLSEQDRQVVARHLGAIAHPVQALFFTQTIGASETVLVTRQILDEVAALSDKITIAEVNFILERDRAAAYGVEQVPAIVLLRRSASRAAGPSDIPVGTAWEDTGIRFLGAPAGYEFMSLVEALILAGSDDSGLSPGSKALIAEHVKQPLELLVFATPT